MNDLRSIDISIDTASWGGKPVPPLVTALGALNPMNVSVAAALLHTALVTRPPRATGFSLSDTWAFMRYRPAIDNGPRLRLREEWGEIDPHQKTILSDDLGMGFTTYLFSLHLDFRSYADTVRYVRVVNPAGYELLRRSRNGQYKSPDFVALDGAGRVNVVECKGTQTSRDTLLTAVGKGISQKRNFGARAGYSFALALSAGLFIPQFNNSEDALIHVCDPSKKKLESILSQVPADLIESGVVQIDLAKHFALMGMFSIAARLDSFNPQEERTVGDVDRAEAEFRLEGTDTLSFATGYTVPPDALAVNGEPVRGIVFRISCPLTLYSRLVGSNNLRRELHSLAQDVKARRWIMDEGERGARLMTPLGFTLSLDYVRSEVDMTRGSEVRDLGERG